MNFIKDIFTFFLDNIPSPSFIAWFFPSSIIFCLLSLSLAGWLKRDKHWKTGYSRKTFHFITFFTAGFVQYKFGLGGTFVFGWGATLVIAYALYKGDGNLLYEAMAREKDAPQRTAYIVYPYLATLLGGLAVNFFFPGMAAMVAYFVTGLGDAAGEPVGTRFGKHKYKVPSIKGVVSYRSYEGSFGVFCAAVIAICLALLFHGEVGIVSNLPRILGIAFLATLVEAVSPHGWDNFTSQLVAGAGAYYWLS